MDNPTTNGHFPETCPTCSRTFTTAVTPPATPVVAREIAREWMNTHHAAFETNKEQEDALAAIITRHLASPTGEGEEETEYERGAQWGIDHAQSEYLRGVSDLHSRVASALRETKENFISVSRALEIIDAAALRTPVGGEEK